MTTSKALDKAIKKFLEVYFYFLILFLPLAFIQKCEDAYYLPQFTLLISALIYWVFFILHAGKIKTDAADKIIFAFLAVYALGLIKTIEKTQGLIAYLEWPAAASLYFYGKYFTPVDARKKALLAAFGAGTIAGLYALAQSAGFDLPGWLTNYGGRAFSTFGNPDFFGGFLVMIIPMTIAFGALFNKKKLAVLFFIFFTFTLVITQTRSSFAAFALSLLVLLISFRKKIMANRTSLIAAAVVLFVMTWGAAFNTTLSQRMKAVFSPGNSDFAGRVEMAGAGVKMAAASPLIGAGLANIKNIFFAYRHGKNYFETDHLHNDYVEVAAANGIPAALLFAAMLFFLLRATGRERGIFEKSVLASMAALLFHALFNFPFFIIPTKAYFFILAGLALRKEQNDYPAGGTQAMFLAAALVLCLLVSLKMTAGSVAMNYGINSAEAGNNTEAAYFYRKADALYPAAKKYYYFADLMFRMKKYPEAQDYINRFLGFYPGSKSGNLQAGIISAEQGKVEGAIVFFDNFLKFYPDDIYALNNKAKAFFMLGREKDALAVFNRVLELSPGDEVAAKNLEMIINKKR